MENFEQLIGNLDLKLFERIKSQSDDEDKESMLACQLATREMRPGYNYLEIGSYLGGSIQPYLLDDKCAKIYSLDKRPARQPDARGGDYIYLNNSTERMMNLLKEVAPDKIGKITTIDGDTRSLDPQQIKDKMQICFIDGEHTDEAVLADFKFCLNTLDESGLIMFHDAEIIYNGIADCIQYLEAHSIRFRAYNLPLIVFTIEIGDFPVHKHPLVLDRLINNHTGYLASLQSTNYYRQFATKPPFRFYRKIIAKMKGSNISE